MPSRSFSSLQTSLSYLLKMKRNPSEDKPSKEPNEGEESKEDKGMIKDKKQVREKNRGIRANI